MSMTVSPENAARNAEILRLDGEGLTYDQIAASLGVSRNVVAGAVFRNATRERNRPFGKTPKLSPLDVAAIRSEHRPGVRGFGMPTLARRYGVTTQAISLVLSRKIWAHVA